MNVVAISEAYGNQANVGGRADIKTGSIDAKHRSTNIMIYNLFGVMYLKVEKELI